MKIVADANIAQSEHYFGAHGQLVQVAGRNLSKETIADADALIVRSVTQVNQALLAGSQVCFVGTCTIGTDHIDTAYIAKEQLGFASAPGCNAVAAAQFTLAALFKMAPHIHADFCVGIIGCGNVGSRLKWLLDALNIRNKVCDPFLDNPQIPTVDLAEVLRCDAISVHTPLTKTGSAPTLNMLDNAQLAQLPQNGIVINTARGAIINAQALKTQMARKNLQVFLDVWPQEPSMADELLQNCCGSPHVAGYSLEGKLRGTQMVYRQFCDFFKLDAVASAPALPILPSVVCDGQSPIDAARQLCEQSIFLKRDQDAMRQLAGLSPQEKARGFDALRRDYPPRREWSAYTINAQPQCQAAVKQLQRIFNAS